MGKHPGGRPPIFKSVEELQEKIDAYKEYLETSGKPPTIAGLAYYTGIDRKTLFNYKQKDEFFPPIKKFVDWIISTYEEQAAEKGNAGIIFLMKNYGYTDKQQVETTGEITLKVKSPEDIEENEY
jgi:hypothetical protein